MLAKFKQIKNGFQT